MCGSTKAPPVVQQNPVADEAKAQAAATAQTNAEIAQRRRRRQQNSLLTMGATGTDAPVNTLGTLLQQASGPLAPAAVGTNLLGRPPTSMGDMVGMAFGMRGRSTLG